MATDRPPDLSSDHARDRPSDRTGDVAGTIACQQLSVQPMVRRLRRHRFRLSFDDPELEQQWRDDAFETEVRPDLTRVLLALMATGLVWIAVDFLVVRDVFVVALSHRLFVISPVWMYSLYRVRTDPDINESDMTVASVLGTGLVAGSFLVIGVIADPPGGPLYLAYAAVFPLAAPPLGRWRSGVALLFNATMLAGATVAVALLRPELGVGVFLLVTHVVAGGFGVLAAGVVERFSRQNFLQRRDLQEQQARSDRLVRNILPSDVADRLAVEPGFVAEHHDDVTVLFADAVGFTATVQQYGARAVIEVLDEMFSRFDELVVRHRVEKIKTIGDAYMVAAGLHGPSEQAPSRVADFALALLAEADRFGRQIGFPIEFRVGVDTGPVVAGVIGRRKFQYDLWGDTVNVASRLESHGTPGRVQVTERVAERLRGHHEVEPRGAIELRGRGSVPTYWLVPPVSPGGADVGSERHGDGSSVGDDRTDLPVV